MRRHHALLLLGWAILGGWYCGDDSTATADDGGEAVVDEGADADAADGDTDVPADADADADGDGDIDAPADDAAETLDDGGGPPTAEVHFNGRFDRSDPAAPRFAWSASSIRARFSGTGISITLDAEGGNVFEVLIDGAPQAPIETSWGEETFGLASGLSAGEHEVELVRRTEAFFGAVSFVRFDVTGGSLVASPWPWAHRVEFVGDSITAGYGALGPDQYCSFSADTESAWVSYASVAARALGAAPQLIAWSGKGVVQNYGGDRDEPLPELYERTIPTEAGDWGFDPPADAVVLNLGTNDFSTTVDQAEFEAGYRDLILLVRSRNPTAAIYCVGGDFLNATATTYIANAIAATGDGNVELLELPGVLPSEGWGCDWHPSEATHLRIGGLVAERLRADLGW
ncbi:MAG: acetyl xylan esterase [Deltaproteobacteria bacterium]|nr:acetyl xylan esterase [Deltaproteobacteria bacterium]